jgi:hypothetical protein
VLEWYHSIKVFAQAVAQAVAPIAPDEGEQAPGLQKDKGKTD